MGAVFLKLLHMSLAAAMLVVVVMALRLLLKNAPKAIHCALWALVALRLLLPVSVESPLSLIPENVAQGEILAEWQDDYVGEVSVIYNNSALYNEAVAAGREPFADGDGRYYVVTAPDWHEAPETVETAVLPILGWVWLSGCVVMLGYALVSFLRIRSKVKVSLRLRDNIWRSEAVDSPFILGFVRPKIYLPYDMDDGQTQYVIAHEEAHLRRRDHWWKPLGFLLLAVYWFNPLLWVAYLLLCRDIELACDEKVIREMDAQEKKAYSEALLECSLPRRMVAACPLAFGEVGVKQRIASVLHYKKPAFWVLVLAVIACIVVAVCFLTNPKDTLDGEVYTYEKSGVLGNFTITLFEDGTFAYTEGMASSYYATGHWQEVGNILTLTDNGDYGLVNRFRKDGDTLYFIAQGSSNFTYVTVKDSERFVYTMDVNYPLLDGDWDAVQTITVPGYAVVNAAVSEKIFFRVATSSPEEMLAYLCQADLWDDTIKKQPEISSPSAFGPAAVFYSAPQDGDALDAAMARRAYLLMRLYPQEVFHVLWTYPDGSGGIIHRELHTEEMSAIVSLSSHTEVIASPDSAESVEQQLGFLGSLDEKLFLTFASAGNELSPLHEAQKTAVWFTPEDIHDIEYMELLDSNGLRLTISTEEGYEYAQRSLSSAAEHLIPACPFHSVLYLHRADGVVGKILPANDGCRTFQANGKYYSWSDPYTSNNETFYSYFDTVADQFSISDAATAALFDTILSSPADAAKPADYLKAHPNEHTALLTDENTTLRYIFTQFLMGDQPEPRGQVMRTILDQLAPEAQLRLYTETGQAYFDEWIASADSVATQHGLEWMEKNQPNMYLALQIRSEIYGHSSPAFPADAPKLPKPLKLEAEVQQAACNAILASLSTGWWTAQELDPAYEAAAFTCFHHETVGDEVNLYGFGGYFSQDAQGNAADEWSSFTIVTLNKSTLDLVQVWWPGDGGYYVMSIDESFPAELAKAVNMISSDDYQTLKTQLRKQAAENMAPAGLPLSPDKTRCFTIDGSEVHSPGSYIKSEWKESSKFDEAIHCHYDVQWDHALCLRCGTPFSYETVEESYAVHRKEVVYNEDGSEKGFSCAECGYQSW